MTRSYRLLALAQAALFALALDAAAHAHLETSTPAADTAVATPAEIDPN